MKAFLILLLAIAGGCVTKVERMEPLQPAAPVVPTSSEIQHQNDTDKRIAIDKSLNRTIRIVRITSKVSPEGYLKIQLNVQNLTGSSKQFLYRIEWIDGDGMALPMAGTALDWMLLSHETSFLAATAPTPAAKDFRVFFAPK